MEDNPRKNANVNVNSLLGNITPDRRNPEGQFVHMGYPAATANQEAWNLQNKLPQNHYVPRFGMVNAEPQFFSPVDHQFNPQVPYNYLQSQQQLYSHDPYEKRLNNDTRYDPYPNIANSPMQDLGMFSSDYKLFMPHMNDNFPQTHPEPSIPNSSPVNSQQSTPNRTQLIENLVGNWIPNTSGTYSPFGNVPAYKPNIFESTSDIENLSNNMVKQVLDDPPPPPQDLPERPVEDNHFQFTRDTKKPRIVAEVKPMRPSYSDVLLKSAPQPPIIKSGKAEVKETKQKKEVKKSAKGDKQPKVNNLLNRSNTSTEIKDIPLEKANGSAKNNDKTKEGKGNQLNRKWASLDNVSEAFDVKTDFNDRKIKKPEDNVAKNVNIKANQKKNGKSSNDYVDTDSGSGKNDSINITKNSAKKVGKVGVRTKIYENFGNSERPPGKRAQRNRKRENHVPLGDTSTFSLI